MKRCFALALALACLLPLPGRARGDDFADFRIPTHRVLVWTGDFDGTWRGYTSDFGTSRSHNGDFLGTTGSNFRRLTDGDDSSADLFLSVFFQGTRSNFTDTRLEQYPVLARSSDHRSSGRSTGEQAEAGCSFGRYVGGAPIVLGADAKALGQLNQSWNNSRDVSSQTDYVSTTDQWIQMNERRRQSDIVVSLRPRIGLGRVRDATGVYVARVIEERLRRDGVLTRELSHDARQRLADLLTLRDAYNGLHARPAKAMWAEVERILGDDGALAPGGLDASSTQHAGEPLLDVVARGRRADGLPGTIVLRQRGASASAFVSGAHQRSELSDEGGSESQLTLDGVPQPIVSSKFSGGSETSSDAVDAGLEAEWHRPVGLRVQLDASAEASVPLRPQEDGVQVATNGQASWMVLDRWLVQGLVYQRRDLRQDADGGMTRQDQWGFSLAGQVSYELEDHVTIQLRFSDDQYGQRVPAALAPFYVRYSRGQSVFLGLTYRFVGRFSAPGFEGLSRMVRPATGI